MARMLCWVAALICSLVTVYGQYCEKGLKTEVLEMVGELTKTLEDSESLPPGRGENIARGKTAYQTSVIAGGAPGRAVDGKMTPIYNQNSCTHTGRHQNPSWWVDLGKEYYVTSVVIQNRGDCCSHRLRNVVVSVGEYVKGESMPKCAEFGGIFQAGEVKQLSCKSAMKGRYVMVHTGVIDYLSLCEVQVFGFPA